MTTRTQPTRPTDGPSASEPVDTVRLSCPCEPITNVKLIWLEFLSDHKMLKDEVSKWTNTGNLYQKPDWFRGGARQNPVSHSLEYKIKIKILLDVRPDNACPDTAKIEGVGGGYTWKKEGVTLQPGFNEIELESTEKVKRRIALVHLGILWTIETQNSGTFYGNTKNDFYVTHSTPRKAAGLSIREDGITTKRMAKSVDMVGDTNSLVPHEIVDKLMSLFKGYVLQPHPSVPVEYEHPTYFQNGRPPAGGAWPMADYVSVTGECQAICRFVLGEIHQIGLPGTYEMVFIWTDPDRNKGRPVIEDYSGLNGKSKIGPNGRQWIASLADQDPVAVGNVFSPDEMGINNFEACLKLIHGGKLKYYAGGVGAFDTKEDVITVFEALVWWSPEFNAAGNISYRIEEIVRRY